MVKQSVYEYKDYKKFVLDWIQRLSNAGRGQRKLLAAAIGCQTPFVTHVLAGDSDFSAEQAEACARFMGLGESDVEFFLLLVLKQRAGTRSLENLFAKQIAERRERSVLLKKRLNIAETLSAPAQMIYYGSWHFAAIHMALTLPEMRTVDALQKHFQLPMARVVSIVEFLIQNGLVEQQRAALKVVRPALHLEKGSPLLGQHHAQWRLRAIEAYHSRAPEDLHYSAVTSLSFEDFAWVREQLASLLEELVGRVRESPEEKLATLTLDWFSL